jgi:hypothetical protein
VTAPDRRDRAVSVVLPPEAASAVRVRTPVSGRRDGAPARSARILARWDAPEGGVTVHRIGWDAANGGSERAVQRAVERSGRERFREP